ncbi:MAG: DASS family sodium-coupled anion symporter [Ignavibacteriota bacterium]|jgi:anion transporter|nr:DASS family sodium-coupled anion symporter [Ignavibacteriota bacterium]MBW7842361.1 DASS family sodium-coupled anion symporter [Ignavibacterium sp.]MCO6446508.1 DASS family sodium-coupled anion symporter [Ignavibacterium album]MCZ2269287.1 DASS family sodium-coupled anion symporter [Ignavibacteriales bacterium]MDX9711111.1 DASS family sodium-coupled anion symporter [Ignavibacteriaceae bacterium]
MTKADILDMSNYRIEKLPKRKKSEFEKRLAFVGSILAVAAFILFAFVIKLPFLESINPNEIVSDTAKNVYNKIGSTAFIRNNEFMLAIFAASIILWMTEAIPNYLTSLILIISLVLTGILPEKTAYAQLGHPVMWLNIMSFVLASMLVTTGLAKRFALWLIVKFGKNASTIFITFIVINLVLSAFISATTAKAAILLPIFMVIAAIYGAQSGVNRNNFGRSIVLQNLLNINIGAGAFVTGAGANLLGAALLGSAIQGNIYFGQWMMAMLPYVILLMIIGYFVAMKIFFPLKPEERLPQIEGGMERLKTEYEKLGPLSHNEIKSAFIFITILGLWATDNIHGISATAVAFVGAIVALLPKVGIVKWNEVDIPWHLMLFSAGAYTLGAALDETDLPSICVNAFFNSLGIGNQSQFWVLYLFLTGVMIFSALIFQSKTMRAMIFIPIAIGVANRFGFDVVSLALPVAFMNIHVYVLPFNSKPAALLYETDQYSLTDTFKYGLTIMIIGWILVIAAGETWFRYLGITPNGVFGI